MNQYSHFAIETSDVIHPQSEVDANEWKLLRRLRLPDKFNDPQSGTIKRAMVSKSKPIFLFADIDAVAMTHCFFDTAVPDFAELTDSATYHNSHGRSVAEETL